MSVTYSKRQKAEGSRAEGMLIDESRFQYLAQVLIALATAIHIPGMGILPVPVVLGQIISSVHKNKPYGCAIAAREGQAFKLCLSAYRKIFPLGEAFKI